VLSIDAFLRDQSVCGRAPPGCWGNLSAPPSLLAAIGGGVLLLKGRERRRGKEEGSEKEEGEGRDCLHFI